MYKKQNYKTNKLKGATPFEGVCIEREMQQIASTQQPINRTTLSQVFYTRRKDGVLPETDIRTDKWELGQYAMDHANKTFKELREKRAQEREAQQTKIE